jgi:hypothetical protein
MGEHVVARASVALGGVSAVVTTVAIRSYLSSQHLWSARHFTRLAADHERDHAGDSRISVQQRAYVLSAVGEAVAFLEAFINELYQDAADDTAGAADGLSPGMVRLMAEHWRGTQERQVDECRREVRHGPGCTPGSCPTRVGVRTRTSRRSSTCGTGRCITARGPTATRTRTG